MTSPHARIAWRTRRLAGVARRLAGPRADAAEGAVRRVLAAPPGGGDPVVGPSGLNNDGVPLQLCMTARPGGTTLRVLGDPVAHLPTEERLRVSSAAAWEALEAAGAGALLPLARRTAELVIPSDADTRTAYRDGFFWIAVSPDRPGAALYVETAPLGPDAGWRVTESWLEEMLPTMDEARPVVAALARHTVTASVGLEGVSPAAARAKIYFRFTEPTSFDALGLDLLADPILLDFVGRAMGHHGVDLDGLVMSVGFSLADGALVDVKVDLCGHCLAYTADEWPEVVGRCTAPLGLASLPTAETLAADDCEVAFLGLGLDTRRDARINLYLKPRAAEAPSDDELRAALDDAVDALVRLQEEDGRWVDYQLPVGASNQWVTAYVGTALARAARALDHEPARRAAAAGAHWLTTDRPYDAGWGYNGLTGPDADSTAMALSLLDTLALPVAEADRRFLADLWRPGEGGIATYPGPDAWGHAHWDVTPWAYLVLTEANRDRFRGDFLHGLAANRQADGLWRSYWWRTPLYSTFLTLEALAELGWTEPPGPVPPLSVQVEGAFDLASAVAIGHLRGADRAGLGPALRALLDQQERDGGWPGHPNLRVTDDACAEPWADPHGPIGELYRDLAGTITTATVVRMLAHLLAPTPIHRTSSELSTTGVRS